MEKQEIGRFYATTYNDEVFEFIVYDNNTMDCPTINMNSIIGMIIKPIFILYGKDFIYTKSLNNKNIIIDYNIEDELFVYLKENKMIAYSEDIASVYNFNDKCKNTNSNYRKLNK